MCQWGTGERLHIMNQQNKCEHWTSVLEKLKASNLPLVLTGWKAFLTRLTPSSQRPKSNFVLYTWFVIRWSMYRRKTTKPWRQTLSVSTSRQRKKKHSWLLNSSPTSGMPNTLKSVVHGDHIRTIWMPFSITQKTSEKPFIRPMALNHWTASFGKPSINANCFQRIIQQ